MHNCGWCGVWSEVRAVYEEGRREEAILELHRIQWKHPESRECLINKYIRGMWLKNGENVDGL